MFCCRLSTVYSYSLVWDNTQKFVQARSHSRQSSNKMLMWANAYAARNRVPVPHNAFTQRTLLARHIPLSVSNNRPYTCTSVIVFIAAGMCKVYSMSKNRLLQMTDFNNTCDCAKSLTRTP